MPPPWVSSPKLQSALELALPPGIGSAEAAAPLAVEDEVLALFDECAAPLLRYVSSFGLGPDTAQDLLQDVFLALFQHLERGRPRTNLKGWLFRVAHNLALKQRHKGLKRRQTEDRRDDTLLERAIDPAATPEQRLLDGQRRRRLRAVLRLMPERDQQCLYLRAEGLCYRDIAGTLGISLGSVAKSLTRAIVRLMIVDRG